MGLSTLLAAVQATDLVETHSGEGPSLCSLRQTRPLLRFPRTPWTLSLQTRRHSQPYFSVTLFLGLLWPLAMFHGAPHHWTLLAVRVLRSPGIVTSRSSPLPERPASSPSTSWQRTE